MKQKRNLWKRYVFFVMLFFACLLHENPRAVFAADRTVRLTETAEGAAAVALPAEQLFTKPVYPGSRETCTLTIDNDLPQPVRLCLEAPAADSADANALYRALRFSICETDGTCLYEGPPDELQLLLNEIPKHKKQRLKITMELPREADCTVAGLQTRLRFVLRGVPAEDGSSGNENKPSGGSYGTGLKGIDMSAGGGSGADSNGCPIIYDSPYTRVLPANRAGSGSNGADDAGSGMANGAAGAGAGNRYGFAGKDGAAGGEAKLFEAPDLSLAKGCDSGSWEKTANGGWQYRFADGTLAANGFLFARNPYHSSGPEYEWFYFNANALLVTGWIRSTETCWYHAHEASDGDRGALEIGWLDEPQDGRSYYLRENDAKMAAGWLGFAARSTPLAVEYYYFATFSDTHRQNWFQKSAFGRWIYDRLGFRSYGSLYTAETTPDGIAVDADGKKKEVSP